MSPTGTLLATLASLLAFAANSLLARGALADGAIGPGAFTAIRITSGALTLWLLIRLRERPAGESVAARRDEGSWRSAIALFVYAIAFSYAYLSLEAGTGALILFGSVQITMIAWGFIRGERPRAAEWFGFALAASGLYSLLAPSEFSPDALGALLMAAAGVGWGAYSIQGQGGSDPIAATASNFLRAAPLTWIAVGGTVAAGFFGGTSVTAGTALPSISTVGVCLALASGAITSGLGYVIWYQALPNLTTTTAAIVQLSVPMIAALGGVILLGEQLTLHLFSAGSVILVGVAIAVLNRSR